MQDARFALTALVASILLVGCQSTADWMASTQPKAVQAAETRGRFELNCPAAKGTVLSEHVAGAQAFRYRGPDRAVFTVGVSGCEKRGTYVVICPDDGSGNCFAADGQR